MAHQKDLSTIFFRGSLGLLAALTIVLLIAPTAVVLIVSFTDGYSLKFPPVSYSTRWYVELWNASHLHFAAMNSIKVGLATTFLSVVFGVLASLAIVGSKSGLARILDSLFMSPLVLPALAFGFAALMTVGNLDVGPAMALSGQLISESMLWLAASLPHGVA